MAERFFVEQLAEVNTDGVAPMDGPEVEAVLRAAVDGVQL